MNKNNVAKKTEELKLCPFCGTKPTQVSNTIIKMYPALFVVECPRCTATVKAQDTPEKAISEWNKRICTIESEDFYSTVEFCTDNPNYSDVRDAIHAFCHSVIGATK